MESIDITNIREFMRCLFTDAAFDDFSLVEAEISTYNDFSIDGHTNKDFFAQTEYNTESIPEFSSWQQLRPVCFSFIKGRQTPLRMKFIFHAPANVIAELISHPICTLDPSLLKALVLTIKYNGSNTCCTSATAMHTFIMDKSLDTLWDKWVIAFLSSNHFTD